MTHNSYPHVVPPMPSSPDNCSPDWAQSDYHKRMQAIRQKHNVDNINTVNNINNLDNPIKDNINNPSHYLIGGIETIDYMQAKSTPEEFKGHLRLTAIKYLSRAGHKDNILQEYKKAKVYLDWLVKFEETGSIK